MSRSGISVDIHFQKFHFSTKPVKTTSNHKILCRHYIFTVKIHNRPNFQLMQIYVYMCMWMGGNWTQVTIQIMKCKWSQQLTQHIPWYTTLHPRHWKIADKFN